MIGTTVAHHTITEKLGEGGMGEVYRAHDTKLNRDVALKILPQVFALDTQRMARFEREAQVLASLNHTHIAQIYGLEEADGTKALVLELVEGETLQEQIALGPIPIDEALKIALQICEGLEAAHEKGIIHRDLKPANIKITPDGQVKILDFGLAKALEGETPVSDLSHSPTITHAATQAGMILGTAAYMSPEQARGKQVDKRTDIWAFGCVLYEMLTGKRAFGGNTRDETVSDVLASILAREPDWGALPRRVAPPIVRLLKRCLSKDPRTRIQAIGDARLEVSEWSEAPFAIELEGAGAPLNEPMRKIRRKLTWQILAVTLAAIGGAGITWYWLKSESSNRSENITRFAIGLPPEQQMFLSSDSPHLAISRDGQKLAWVGQWQGTRAIFIRDLDDPIVRQVSGSERIGNGSTCFFSPDGTWIGFVGSGTLLKIPVEGGVPTGLFEAANPTGVWEADWGDDGTIVFSSPNSGLHLVSSQGEGSRVITNLDASQGEVNHGWVSTLPDGHGVLFGVGVGNFNNSHVEVVSLGTGKRTRLIEDTFYAQYTDSGHLIFARAGTLYAVPFALDRLEVTGPEVPILPDVQMDTSTGRIPHFAVARNGTLVLLRSGQGFGNRGLRWVDRNGQVAELTGLEDAVVGRRRSQGDLDLGDPRLSPDGRKIALTDRWGHVKQIGIFDITRRVFEAFTSGGNTSAAPVWSPDGSQVAYLSNQLGQYNAFLLDVQDRAVRRLVDSPNIQWPTSWSPTGEYLLIGDRAMDDQQDVWLIPVNNQEFQPRAILNSKAYESHAVISSNGQYLAFVAADQGQPEVFVTAFTGEGVLRGTRTKVSRAGGREPVWSPESSELFFLSLDGAELRSVLIHGGEQLEVTEEETLLNDLDLPPHDWMATGTSYYDVDRTGEKFLMVFEKRAPEIMELTVVLNWLEELKRLVPTE